MNDIAILIRQSGLSLSAFAAEYHIPYRTVQDWNAGRRVPPPYVVNLLQIAMNGKQGDHPAQVVS